MLKLHTMKTKSLLAALMAVIGAAQTFGATLGAAFTYQGRLDDGEQPANGNYDFSFVLWDSPANGAVVGNAVYYWALPVTNGLFTVELNTSDEFGPSAFNGSARWLEISTRTNGANNFVPLLPRQSLTATPYRVLRALRTNRRPRAQRFQRVQCERRRHHGSQARARSHRVVQRHRRDGRHRPGPRREQSAQRELRRDRHRRAGRAQRSPAFRFDLGRKYFLGHRPQRDQWRGQRSGPVRTASTGSGFPYILGNTAGVWGESSQGSGVHGASGYSGGAGLRGIGMGSSGYGVYGVALATNGSNCGVYGESKSPTGNGVFGRQNNGSGFAPIGVYAGVWGDSASHYGVFGVSKNGSGVVGLATATNGYTFGVSGESDADSGTGVSGLGYSNTGKNKGVSGVTHSVQGVGVYGLAGNLPSNGDHTTFTAAGVWERVPRRAASSVSVIPISASLAPAIRSLEFSDTASMRPVCLVIARTTLVSSPRATRAWDSTS